MKERKKLKKAHLLNHVTKSLVHQYIVLFKFKLSETSISLATYHFHNFGQRYGNPSSPKEMIEGLENHVKCHCEHKNVDPGPGIFLVLPARKFCLYNG